MSLGCPATTESEIIGSNILAQHLFLGASVNSFSTNISWGGSTSTLNVDLISDFGSVGACNIINSPNLDIFNIKEDNGYDVDNHYYNCIGNNCYIDEKGFPYDPNRKITKPDGPNIPQPSKEKRIPGKVYHYVGGDGDIVSRYWRTHDPGFFGAATILDPKGRINPRFFTDSKKNRKILPYKYNIIGSPVLFRYGHFTFGGIVTSWNATINGMAVKDVDTNSINIMDSPITYRVTISSADVLLDNSKVILEDYSGSIFCSLANRFGGPTNYTGSLGNYTGLLKNGNIPNVFNVYGFAESYGFGTSQRNDQGMPLSYVLDSLCLLTSAAQGLGNKAAFSPFGRIVAPTLLTDAIDDRDQYYANPTYADFKEYSFGLLTPELDSMRVPRVNFALDLSEIPRPPTDIRIQGNNGVISITDLIRRACEITGKDWFTTVIRKNGINFIKIKTIDRTRVIPNNIIEKTIKDLTNSSIPVTQSSFGQSNHKATPRVMLIGGNQKRLYQAKSFLLGYSNTHLVYHPVLNKFVDYYRFQKSTRDSTNKSLSISKSKKFVDAVKIPLAYSTRNLDLCKAFNGEKLTEIWSNEQSLGSYNLDTPDPGFSDIPVGGALTPVIGNYNPAATFGMDSDPIRYLPLYLYTISPFFGYVNDVKIPQDSEIYTNRFMRPVYLDSVTGQIVVMFGSDELPVLSIGRLPPLFENRPSQVSGRFGNLPDRDFDGRRDADNGQAQDRPNQQQPAERPKSPTPTQRNPFATKSFKKLSFSITESEFRAAQQSIDSYLTYCIGKLDITKPDLFVMLIKAYQAKGKAIVNPQNTQNIEAVTQATGDFAGASMGGANSSGPVAGVQMGNIEPSFPDLLNINFNLVLNYEFLQDLRTICEFIKGLADDFYGKQYAVSLPSLLAYKDKQYADIQIQVGSNNIGVYQGSGKIFYNYDITDSAWEEPGNVIDDSIVIGTPVSYTFTDERGMISPIIGYNSTPIKDYATEKWCLENPSQRTAAIRRAVPDSIIPSGIPINCSYIRSNYELANLYRYFSCDKSICPSLDLGQSPSDSYVLLNLSDSGREDAYGNRSIGNLFDPCGLNKTRESIQTQKLYIKTTCEPQISFLDPFNLRNPKAIIKSPGIDLAFSSMSYKEDPNRSVISNIASEDLAYIEYLKQSRSVSREKIYALIGETTRFFNYDIGRTPSNETLQEMRKYRIIGPSETFDDLISRLRSPIAAIKGEAQLSWLSYLLLKLIVPITSDNYLLKMPDSDQQSKMHAFLSPKKANPIFVAIPLVDNISCYGPWTNYPALADQSIVFPDIKNTNNLLEQLISDVDVERNTSWVPWEYGGMAFLDRAILYEMNNRVSYQTKTEEGDLTIAGSPIFSMGGNMILKKTDQDININTIKFWMGLSYHALQFAEAYSYFNDGYSGLTISDLNLNVSAGSVTTRYGFSTYSPSKGLFNKENNDRLRIMATQRLSLIKKIQNLESNIANNIRKEITERFNNRVGKGEDISNYKSKLFGTSPTNMIIGQARNYLPIGEYQTSNIINTSNKSQQELLYNKVRFDSTVGQYETREGMNELSFGYSKKAGMSFDGLYSPISFYPTSYQSTFSISSRYVSTQDKEREIVCPGCDNTYKITIIDKDYPCPLCQKPKILPIAPTTSDSSQNNENNSTPIINFNTLNPIILPTGEFKNINAQPIISGERSRHNISFIARQEFPIRDRDINFKNNLTNYECSSDKPHPDWTDIDLSYKEDFEKSILLNNRFFAHRGPLMLHGWGYDTDGYPVPNAADEPKEIDSDGRPKRFFLTSSGTNDLSQDGSFLPTTDKQLGDIIGKGWTKENGEWKRQPSNKFYLNWGERPDLWPIGPIDLRWDYENKIWVGGGGGAGCNNADPPYIIASGNNNLTKFIQSIDKAKKKCSYKMVYGVLEHDMTKLDNYIETNPTRAFLDDLEYGLKPLPENIRRLIYIVDRTGYTAPRGAKILLRYNIDTGFYEPVSKQQYIVFGLINNNGTASVELSYMPGYKSGDSTYKTNIKYSNPLNLESKSSGQLQQRGVFMYDNSRWNLISVG